MTAPDWLAPFLADERLPSEYMATVEAVGRPLVEDAKRLRAELGRTVVLGICGTQASGKSTIAKAAARLLADEGFTTAVLSLDDVYLTREERQALAAAVHPLLSVRGPPGTHDVDLACRTLDALAGEGEVALPRFDKAADTRLPREGWDPVQAPVDVVIFEGWCIGARPQPPADLASAVNALEASEDPDGACRRWIDGQLAGPYQALFGRLDWLALLKAPGFEVVLKWRTEQEAKLHARTGRRGMADEAIARFIAHYERLTRWILAEMPDRADRVFPLDEERRPTPPRPALL